MKSFEVGKNDIIPLFGSPRVFTFFISSCTISGMIIFGFVTGDVKVKLDRLEFVGELGAEREGNWLLDGDGGLECKGVVSALLEERKLDDKDDGNCKF
jgi:hypothetical protein